MVEQRQVGRAYLAVVQDDTILDHEGHLELATGKSKIGFILIPQQVEPYNAKRQSTIASRP
jgi:hypothetical protein